MSDTDYLNQIHQLVELQKVDDDIHEVRQGLENAPLELEELRRKYENLDGVRNVELDKGAHLEDQKKRLSIEIDDDSARIRKSRNKMMQVGNSREYNAMIREMDNMERSNRTREEERLTLLEALEQHHERMEEIDSEYNELKAIVEEKTASLDEQTKLAEDRLAVLDSQRRQFSAGIPRPIFMRYEFIRNRLEHPVIVPVDDGICSGCNIAIPPQTYIELQMGQQILSCPNCQRLIYWNQHFEEPGAEKKSRKPRKQSGRRNTEPEEMEVPFDETEDDSYEKEPGLEEE